MIPLLPTLLQYIASDVLPCSAKIEVTYLHQPPLLYIIHIIVGYSWLKLSVGGVWAEA